MSKKGLSIEEKKIKMLELFHETGECFQLKELEKLAPKLKGIVVNSVKDVIQKLQDDGLIDHGKIGNSVFFWSFQSKSIQSRKRKLEEVTSIYDQQKKRLTLVEQNSSNKTEEKNKIKEVSSEIIELELEIDILKKKLIEHEENDPEKVDTMKDDIMKLKEAANRWTDNVFSIKTWCKKKFLMEEKVLDKQFGIPQDFDYVE
ncbi:hypothetical protein ABEB36_010517 [Hypothenemus hampei]|uniref:Meiotic nuclear division protein 1 homolog n=1 Tax=Hypothenemus hampei TaxID=57062 RepID=A0ABD1EKH5_HYPHA